MCDAMWLCERGEHGSKSTLIGRGRDIMDFEFALDWNPETWRYDLIGDLGLVTLNDNRKEILKAMEEIGANTAPMKKLLAEIQKGTAWETAVSEASIPEEIKLQAMELFLTNETEHPNSVRLVE